MEFLWNYDCTDNIKICAHPESWVVMLDRGEVGVEIFRVIYSYDEGIGSVGSLFECKEWYMANVPLCRSIDFDTANNYCYLNHVVWSDPGVGDLSFKGGWSYYSFCKIGKYCNPRTTLTNYHWMQGRERHCALIYVHIFYSQQHLR